jgi:hypothetical protein
LRAAIVSSRRRVFKRRHANGARVRDDIDAKKCVVVVVA